MDNDKKIRKPKFEKSRMTGIIEACRKLYDEVRQWCGETELTDDAGVRITQLGIVSNLGYMSDELAYHGWRGKNLKRESDNIEAVVAACEYLKNTLEDIHGIQSEEYKWYLNNDGYGRYQLINTQENETSLLRSEK